MNARIWKFGAASLVLTLAAACHDGEAQKDQPAKSAESAKPRSKLEQAVQAAADTSASALSQGQGPPPNGVFGPGQADQVQPPGAPLKVTVVTAGDDPKVTLGTELPAAGSKFVVVVDKQMAPGGSLPKMNYTVLVVRPDAQDTAATPAAAASAKAAPSADPALGRPIVFKIAKAELDREQPGRLPPDAAKLIAKLSGSKVTATVTAAGALTLVQAQVPNEAKDVAQVFFAMVEALELFFSPVPGESVGVGASWIVSDRTQLGGMPLIRYRVTKLNKVSADEVALAIEVRHYAVDGSSVPDGLPDGVQTVGFNSFGKASYGRKRDNLLPLEGEVLLPVVMAFGQAGAPGPVAQLKTQLEARLKPIAAEEN
jgi:hypothetical protein